MKKIIVAIITVFALSLTFSNFTYAQEANDLPLVTEEATTTTTEEKPTLYVRQGCQFCARVKEFLTRYNLNDKVEIKETFNNETNQKELEDMFKKYDAPASDQGVPFMVLSEDEYMVGDKPIINYFAEKYDIEVTEPEYEATASDTIFMVIGGAFLLSILGYGLYSVFKKN